MSQNFAVASIQFPERALKDDNIIQLVDEYVERDKLEVKNGIVFLHCSEVPNGEFEDLERELVVLRFPFDRFNGEGIDIWPEKRYVRFEGDTMQDLTFGVTVAGDHYFESEALMRVLDTISDTHQEVDKDRLLSEIRTMVERTLFRGTPIESLA